MWSTAFLVLVLIVVCFFQTIALFWLVARVEDLMFDVETIEGFLHLKFPGPSQPPESAL